MNIKYLFIFFFVSTFVGCSTEPPRNLKGKKSAAIINHKNSKSDTLVIDHKIAVEVQLDSAALEQNKKKYGDTTIEAYAEDGAYYQSVADSIIRQKKLPLMESSNYKFIKFVQNNGAITIVKVDTLQAVSTLFFFHPAKPPHIVDVTDAENEYKSYFK